jgi:hypothetical protein
MHKVNVTKAQLSLMFLTLIVSVTTFAGAVFVVPSLPLEWIRFFPDYTIPALGLGAIGAVTAVAAVAVAVRPKIGGELSFVAGLMMMCFEVVEAIVVGNLLAPPPGTNSQGNAALWLQVVYLVIGFAMAVLGLRLWTQATPQEGWSQRFRHPLAI